MSRAAGEFGINVLIVAPPGSEHRGGAAVATRPAPCCRYASESSDSERCTAGSECYAVRAKDSERRGQERSDQTTKCGGRTMRGEGRRHVVGKLALMIGALLMAPTPFMATPSHAEETIKAGWVG